MSLFVAWQFYSGIQIHLLKRQITDHKNMVCTKLRESSIPVRPIALDTERAGLELCFDRVLEIRCILNSD